MSDKISFEEWLAEFERIKGEGNDEMYKQAVSFAVERGRISESLLRAKLNISRGTAGVLIARMEIDGIVTPYESGTARKILLRKKEKNNGKD